MNLLGNSGQLFFQKTIELVEATPSAAFDQADEDATHRLIVKTLVTVENEHLAAKDLTQRFDCLGLTRTGGSVGVSTVSELHAHHKGQVTLVCKRCVDEFGCVALILIRVVKERIAHAHLQVLPIEGVPELFVPHPVIGLPGLHNAVSEKLIDNRDVVDDVEDERLHLDEEKVVAFVVKARVAFELALEVLLVVLEFALLDRVNTVARESYHLGKAADLRGQVHDVQAAAALHSSLEQLVKGDPHNLFQFSEPILNFNGDLDRLGELDIFASRGDHRFDLSVFLVEFDLVDAAKELLQVSLDHQGILSLTQNLKQVIVTDEVESRELLTLLLEVVIQSLLAHVKLVKDQLQGVFESLDLAKGHHFWIPADSKGDRSVFFVNSLETALLLTQSTPHKDRL